MSDKENERYLCFDNLIGVNKHVCVCASCSLYYYEHFAFWSMCFLVTCVLLASGIFVRCFLYIVTSQSVISIVGMAMIFDIAYDRNLFYKVYVFSASFFY